ncbi:MAG: hypothetical protein WCZ48_02475, partial [Bacillota bacterium]
MTRGSAALSRRTTRLFIPMEVRQEAEPYRHIVRSDLAYSALPKHCVHVYSDTKSGVRLVPQPKSRMGRDSAV